MTGTADSAKLDFQNMYGMEVENIPTHLPNALVVLPDVVKRTENEKIEAIVADILAKHASGQPVLVGGLSKGKADKLYEQLQHARRHAGQPPLDVGVLTGVQPKEIEDKILGNA